MKSPPSWDMPRLWVRLPEDVKAWLAAQAERNGSSQSSEVTRSVRERMDREIEARASRNAMAGRVAE